MNKVIFVIDLDAFFASVAEVTYPELRGKPVAVGREVDGKGVAAAVNYLVKENGGRSGHPYFKLKQLVPDINFVEIDFDEVLIYSERVFSIVKEYSDAVELGSIDEAYVDVTQALKNSGKNAVDYASHIQRRILRETGLGVSIGISSNRILAKMASGMDKPKGITTLWESEISYKLWNLDVSDMYYVGPATAEKLRMRGINQIGDIAAIEKNSSKYQELEMFLGVHWNVIWGYANGISSSRVVSDENHFVKSIGKAETYGKYLNSFDEVKEQFYKLTKIVVSRMEYRNVIGKVININVKSAINHKGPRVAGKQYSTTLKVRTNDFAKIFNEVVRLFDLNWPKEHPIKSLSVSVSSFEDAYYKAEQQVLWNWEPEVMDERSSFKSLLKDLNAMIGYEAVTDAQAISTYKKWSDKSLTNDDRMKFKVWS